MGKMNNNNFKNTEENLKQKTIELNERLKKTEQELTELNMTLEQRVIERTVEVNKLLKDKTRFIDNLRYQLMQGHRGNDYVHETGIEIMANEFWKIAGLSKMYYPTEKVAPKLLGNFY